MPLLRRLIGGALRRARLEQGRTLREVADTARVSLPYLSEVERGRKEVSSEVLAAICRALGLRLADLLEEVQTDLARLEPDLLPVTPPVPNGPTSLSLRGAGPAGRRPGRPGPRLHAGARHLTTGEHRRVGRVAARV
jgi:transcriptional regulator with XRE-family HTH domain